MTPVLKKFVFLLLMAFLGVFSGMCIGSLFLKESSGFEGPAVLFWYGMAGLVAGILIGVMLLKYVGAGFYRIFFVALILSLTVFLYLVYKVKMV